VISLELLSCPTPSFKKRLEIELIKSLKDRVQNFGLLNTWQVPYLESLFSHSLLYTSLPSGCSSVCFVIPFISANWVSLGFGREPSY
jgi:hypothetical protein